MQPALGAHLKCVQYLAPNAAALEMQPNDQNNTFGEILIFLRNTWFFIVP
jgi:hypothetical protein